MKLHMQTCRQCRRDQAFSLVEVMVAIAIVAISFVSLYAGITSGVQVIQLARENLRATQIMVEKMETMRIKSWNELTNGVDVPSEFTESFYPRGVTSKGIAFYGTIKVTGADVETNYRNDIRLVIVTVRWTNASVARSREMQTFVAHEGMQNYVF